MNIMEYKGYQGSIEVDVDSNQLTGKLLFVKDLVTYEASTPKKLVREFHAAVDDYVQTCAELGKEPEKPFSGVFNVRVGPALHRAAALRAQQDQLKLNQVVVQALQQFLR